MLSEKGIIPQIAAMFEEMKAIRHDIHRHPELGYQEHRTSQIVATLLKQWGYTVSTHIGKTGVVGSLTVGSGTKTIGIRAEMDALPIAEQSGLVYASEEAEVMHACGHDGHTVSLLAAAKYLAQTRNFSGTVHLIFQPSEEAGAGALAMIEDGLFELAPCDLLYAMHNYPSSDLDAGQMCLRAGAIMGSADSILVTLSGKGCHAASPHFGLDPIVAAASMIQGLQTIVSRNTNPLAGAVISVTSIHAGNSYNVIPNELTLKLSARSMDESARQLIRQRITEMITQQAASFGLNAEIAFQGEGYPSLSNDIVATDLARKVALQYFGVDKVITDYPSILASDDFAFMAERVPSCYINVGNGKGAALHHPAYDFNDELIVLMGSLWGRIVERFLG